jgi:predicted MPP superfamily phosphohydrolase
MRTVNYLTRRGMLRQGTLGVLGGVLLARSGWVEATELPLVRRVTLFHPALPAAFDGLRLVQIADVHAGVFMPPDRLARVRDLARRLEPELVVFTGDQLDRREVDAEIFVHGFAGLDAPLGVYGILGNHDHLAGGALATAALEAIGAQPLVNRGVVLERSGARLLLAGVDDYGTDDLAGPDFGVLARHDADFRVLLCHRPHGWNAAVAAGAEVTLAGHTHGGQITIPTTDVNLARMTTRFVAGAYRRDGQLLYVSRGIGVGKVPVRIGAPPEVDLVTLRCGDALPLA